MGLPISTRHPLNAIEIDDSTTWPAELQRVVDEARPLIAAWDACEREITDLCRRDVATRFQPALNPYAGQADQFLHDVDDILKQHLLLVRHCSRLHEREIEDITSVGVRPLTSAMTKQRLIIAHDAGLIDGDELETLAANHQADDHSRRGHTFWILGRGPLRDEDAVSPLLTSWGGEAIYWAHEHNEVGQALRTIGTAVVIEAAIPQRDLYVFWGAAYKLRESIATGRPADANATTSQLVPATMLRRVIRYGTDDFEALTGASGWAVGLGEGM